MPQAKDTDCLDGHKNKTGVYAAYNKPTATEGRTQTESEGKEKDIPCEWKSNESWSSNAHIR